LLSLDIINVVIIIAFNVVGTRKLLWERKERENANPYSSQTVGVCGESKIYRVI
jgi:hypothetical protein